MRSIVRRSQASRARALRCTVHERANNKKAAFWDQAIKGSSALQSAIARALFGEVRVRQGFEAGGAFFGIKSFYDCMKKQGISKLHKGRTPSLDKKPSSRMRTVSKHQN